MINRSGIYKITCAANGRLYVGSAVNFRERWNTHRSATRRGKHHSRHLQNAWNKYGQDAFKFEVLLLCAKEDLIMYEQRAIDTLKPALNTLPAAGTPLGYKHTPEAIKNMRAAQKLVGREGRVWQKHTEATKKKLSVSHVGEKNPMYGREVSEHTRKKLSVAHKGKKPHENTRRAATITKQKQWADPAYRAKMVNAVKDRKHTLEEGIASATANGVQVTIGETVYRSTKEAARVVGRHESTLMTWVRKSVVPADNGVFTGLPITRSGRVRPECSRKPGLTRTHNPLTVGDMYFSSRKKAASFFGVTVTTVSQWVDAAVVRKPRKVSFHSRYTGLPVKAIPCQP